MVSFDVFDTLITRKTYSPQGIFLILQERLFREFGLGKYHFCNNFYNLRINAEKNVRLYAEQEDREEITLDEIYDFLADRNDIPKDITLKIKEWEIQTEIDNTYPIIHNIQLLKKFLSEGHHIVLISDMYLSEDNIRNILLKSSSVFRHIPIYVSSEIKKTKSSGSLYFEIAKMEGESFSDWVHFGDNKNSDYLMPKMLGIDAKHIPFEEMTPWENELGKMLGLKNNLTLQFYFGMARNVRLEKKWDIPEKIGGSIGGMLLYPYILWLLRKSIEMGIRRLYFIARDGYILKKIADIVIKNKDLDIYTAYVYGSRRVWRIKEASEIDKQKVIMYLSQEVDFSDSNFAFIDLHGTGMTMECLADVILENFHVRTKVFYFNLIRIKKSNSYKFLSFCSVPSGIAELFCRAPHGATIGYEQKGNQIAPILQPINEIYWERAGLYEYFEGIELFVNKISQYCWDDRLEDVSLAESIIEYCKKRPCEELQNFMGSIPHYDGVEEEKIEYAPKLSLSDIFNIYMWRTVEDISEYYSGADLNFSLMRTKTKYNREREFLEKHYNSVLGRCIHRFKNRKRKCKVNNLKVVIYGAGTIGQRLHEHLITISGFDIVGWTDINYKYYQELGYAVAPLREVLEKNYQYIIIAISNNVSFKQVQNILFKLEVQKEKIVGYKEFLKDI